MTVWDLVKIERGRRDIPRQWHRWRGRIKSGPHCHPLIVEFIDEANAQLTTLQEISERAGVSRVAISDWRNNRNPSIVTFNAALNVLGLELRICKIDSRKPRKSGRKPAILHEGRQDD
jgi:hypothetical protein